MIVAMVAPVIMLVAMIVIMLVAVIVIVAVIMCMLRLSMRNRSLATTSSTRLPPRQGCHLSDLGKGDLISLR